jgi:8-oxo-dGTP pyrophosphatase MutT (NUDIX family)
LLNELKTISKECRYNNPWWDYWVDVYNFPNGNSGEYHYVHSKGATMVVPVLDDGKIIMTKQYRYLNQRVSIEFPGGGKKIDLSFEENAKQELAEESGFEAGKIEYIGEYNPYNGVTDEVTKIYLASNLIKSSAKPDESEEFEILFLSEQEINEKIKCGEIWDGMSLAAWSLYYFSNHKSPK